MNYVGRWILAYCIVFRLNDAEVFTQPYDGYSPTSAELFSEISNELSSSTTAKNQLMNTLLTVAATKGILPELASALQPVLLADSMASSTSVPRSINIVPLAGDPQTEISLDFLTANTLSCSTQSNPYQEYLLYPYIPDFSQGISQQSQISGSPYESYFYSPDFTAYQIDKLDSVNDMYKYFSTIPEMDIATLENFKTAYLPAIKNPDNTKDISVPCKSYKQPVLASSESEIIPPFNIEINVPLPQFPDQILSLLSNEQFVKNTNPNPAPSGELPLPIVISKGKSKSSLKKMLPIMLLAMLLDDNDGSCGSCQCKSEPNFIPIPYPIPFPINNPYSKSKYNSGEIDSSEELT